LYAPVSYSGIDIASVDLFRLLVGL
jgi:hypothetical protein